MNKNYNFVKLTRDDIRNFFVLNYYDFTHINNKTIIEFYNSTDYSKLLTKKDIDLYKTLLLKLVKENDYEAIRILAYQYYNGSIFFPLNYALAVIKLYKLKEAY